MVLSLLAYVLVVDFLLLDYLSELMRLLIRVGLLFLSTVMLYEMLMLIFFVGFCAATGVLPFSFLWSFDSI
jgi:hypothetical protein